MRVFDVKQVISNDDELPKKLKKPVVRRPEGISRELYGLLGGREAPILVQNHYNQFTHNSKIKTKAKPWTLCEFSPIGRSDLNFKHWLLKSDFDAGENNRFQKYNVKAHVPTFTDDEYNKWLQDDSWTREETKNLIKLCEVFNCNFFLVADRLNFGTKRYGDELNRVGFKKPNNMVESGTQQESFNNENEPEDVQAKENMKRLSKIPMEEIFGPGFIRSVDDIKERFYTIGRKLILARNPEGLSASNEELVCKMMFDKEKEIQRKRIMVSMLHRTPEEIREEENLVIEARRIQAYEKDLQQEREELLRIFQEVGSKELEGRNVDVAYYTSSQGLAALASGILHADKMKKKREMMSASSTPSTPTSMAKESIFARIGRLSPSKEQIFGVTWGTKNQASVFVRSQRIPAVKQSLLTKFEAALIELEIPPRLMMPTERTCKLYETLQNAIIGMLQLKATLDKHEAKAKVNEALESNEFL